MPTLPTFVYYGTTRLSSLCSYFSFLLFIHQMVQLRFVEDNRVFLIWTSDEFIEFLTKIIAVKEGFILGSLQLKISVLTIMLCSQVWKQSSLNYSQFMHYCFCRICGDRNMFLICVFYVLETSWAVNRGKVMGYDFLVNTWHTFRDVDDCFLCGICMINVTVTGWIFSLSVHSTGSDGWPDIEHSLYPSVGRDLSSSRNICVCWE